MELSNKQKEIIETKEKKVLVNCAASSGKTRCLTERIKFLVNNYPDKNIIAITFTNAAAEEIKKRIDYIPNTVFIGTIHGYCNYLLLINGILTKEIINEGRFDDLFNVFIKTKIHQTVDFLLLDEGQDSTEIEFNFLLEQLKPKNWMIFSDRRQSIYGFKGACPEYLIKLSLEKEVTSFNLNENYRNGQNILNYASGLMLKDFIPYNYRDNSICCSGRQGKVYEISLNYDWMVKEIQSHNSYKDWFILTRDNKQLDMIKFELEKRGVPCVTFRQANLNNGELSKVMNSDTVKVLTIHSSKGLEAENVMVYGAQFKTREEICCTYVAATRARERLYMLSSPKKKKNNKTKVNIYNWE